MNNNKSIYSAFNRFKKSNDTDTTENDYDPTPKLKIARTVYPKGRKQMSLNGKTEFYGLQEH